ncbi:tRNA uridine(34) 5-carboxymethylaminomethyl modification radical SAM/GNAT enzyme Elp3 [Candidatus Pacearchaeota archaeon]|nr:tRNA uridine(34) 5-carboxymethylaminomethyl modification radical SAM/GNAT enzyme Elp3 [Candidatus Pacearchaeota archaeon]
MLKPKKNEVRKPTKTLSGITPVAVMLPPRKCEHGDCLYCPSLNVPQSYTPKSPVVMRAKELNYDAYKQVKARINAFKAMHHPTEKIELIIMGGTFLEYPEKFQSEFIKGCYDAMNQKTSKNLKQAQKLNEKAEHRCVALCVETRPDVCSKHIDKMREFGVTRVELGVQIIDDKIYKKIQRGHTVKDVINATKNLKNAGFKIGYHIMPGLPGSNFKKDLRLFKKLFSDERFKPDQLKLYPCQVIPSSGLEEVYWKGGYKPYTKKETEHILIEMLKVVPRYCRVMRVMREIPPEYIVAGIINIDLRKDIEAEFRKKNSKLKEIRYREIGFALRRKEVNLDLDLKITKYKSSGGKEYFLEIVNKNDILFGLLRLRLFDNFAIIREIHVYGQALKLGEKGKTSQHRGLGKWLMEEAEKIVKKNKVKKLSVISGVGVREYYKKLGYKLDKTYMVKKF